MTNRWNIITEMVELVASILNQQPINAVHPNYVNVTPQQMLYPIVKNRRLLKCEDNHNLQFYLLMDGVVDKVVSNCSMQTEIGINIGVIRRTDTELLDFNKIVSAMTWVFSPAGRMFNYALLSNGTHTESNCKIGAFGVKAMRVDAHTENTDKCGVYQYEILVKFYINYSRFYY